mmetsp:Transcript_12825/g.32918  ORF Transcript_12825/g.32918 Transcript_12825/m.32918 type:complete len:269 (-) Transcript_12825:2479-3285(-)
MGMYAAFHFVQLTVMNSGDERQLIRIVKVTLADGVVAPRQILRAERQPLASQPRAVLRGVDLRRGHAAGLHNGIHIAVGVALQHLHLLGLTARAGGCSAGAVARKRWAVVYFAVVLDSFTAADGAWRRAVLVRVQVPRPPLRLPHRRVVVAARQRRAVERQHLVADEEQQVAGVDGLRVVLRVQPGFGSVPQIRLPGLRGQPHLLVPGQLVVDAGDEPGRGGLVDELLDVPRGGVLVGLQEERSRTSDKGRREAGAAVVQIIGVVVVP